MFVGIALDGILTNDSACARAQSRKFPPTAIGFANVLTKREVILSVRDIAIQGSGGDGTGGVLKTGSRVRLGGARHCSSYVLGEVAGS